MTPADNQSDPSRPRARVVPAAAVLAGIALAVALAGLGGCSKPPPPSVEGPGAAGAKVEPWKVAAGRLRKDTDVTATKAALAAVGGEKFPAMTDEQLAALEKLVPLAPADRDELRPAGFTAHDAVYLADCLYLRDAARSLGASGLPPDQQADLAFAWVCRQVYLYPWLRALGNSAYEPTALPPTAVLRRGHGSGLERMYVFLALLQQLELDGCLIGPPDAATHLSRLAGPGVRYAHLPADFAIPRGPFWAVGVRVGTDVRMYDPWRGAAVPATLNQLRANPDAAKAWFADPANVSGATPDDAKRATAFLAVPVSALSPRMAALEQNLRAELGAQLAVEPKELEAVRAAFADPKPAVWNPPNDPFAYGRAGRSFLPIDQGGTDPNPPSRERAFEAYRIEQIPASAFAAPAGLEQTPGAVARFREIAVGVLGGAFIESPNPRERIQRGHFQEAARDLVVKQEQFAGGLERLRLNRDADQQIREWSAVAVQLYDEVGTARLNKDKVAEAAALGQVEVHWRQPGAQLLIDQASARIGRAEASLLLALCKHEQAERLQARLERTPTPDLTTDTADAWRTAVSAWRAYEQGSAAHAGFPGRAEHAKALADRAAKLAGSDGKKDEPKK